MNIAIEKKEMPPLHGGKYPWRRLNVGECFEVPSKASGRQLCFQANARHRPKRFEARMIKGKYWIWRTK